MGWTCGSCTFLNDEHLTNCLLCFQRRDGSDREAILRQQQLHLGAIGAVDDVGGGHDHPDQHDGPGLAVPQPADLSSSPTGLQEQFHDEPFNVVEQEEGVGDDGVSFVSFQKGSLKYDLSGLRLRLPSRLLACLFLFLSVCLSACMCSHASTHSRISTLRLLSTITTTTTWTTSKMSQTTTATITATSTSTPPPPPPPSLPSSPPVPPAVPTITMLTKTSFSMLLVNWTRIKR